MEGSEYPMSYNSADAESRSIDFSYSPRLTWTCIGRPDDLYKTIEFSILTDRSPIEIHQVNDAPGNSIVVTVLHYPKATFTLRARGHIHDGEHRTDVVFMENRSCRRSARVHDRL